MLQTSTIKFLKDLKQHNAKEWFDANRKVYESAKEDFSKFIQSVIDTHAKKDPTLASLTAKETMFRINRDVRFSKDKSPYKTNFGASINKGGKKGIYAGYYFHLQPGESFVGGGLWMPMPDELKKVRQEIDYNFDAFKKIINNKKFTTVYGSLYTGEDAAQLTRAPKGYEEDNPAIEFIKMKSFLAIAPVKDEELTSKDLQKKITTAFEALQPLVEFINHSFE
jgi:uncharacterized protein (TIGR02453 family)